MSISFDHLREQNVKRCRAIFHGLEEWSPADWAVAMAGECGEACNVVKKLRRIVDGTNTEKDPRSEEECIELISLELADLVIYCDLLTARLDIDLGIAVQYKFNAVSELRKSHIRLHDTVPGQGPALWARAVALGASLPCGHPLDSLFLIPPAGSACRLCMEALEAELVQP